MKTKIIALLLVASVIVSMVFVNPWKEKSPGDGPKKEANLKAGPMAVNVVIAATEQLSNNINSTGTIMANEEVELRSEIAGRITGIYFNEGGAVTKGQLLVKINDSDFKA